tara:strand:- start:3343 stop:4125 length:783 start_codon:yes stop_codon:yes gene_type:complete
MLTKLRRKLKQSLGQKIIFQPDIYRLDLDQRKFETNAIYSAYGQKIFDLDFSSLSILFQTDKAPFTHNIAPSFTKKRMIRSITQTHNYAKYYDDIFKKKRHNIKNICEIGIMAGASTAAFYFFFPKSKIYTLDINYQRCNIFSKRINKNIVDQSSEASIIKFKKKIKNTQFDLLVDDGSHIDEHIMLTFRNLISKIKKSGYYIIEDVSKELTPNTLKFLKDKSNLKKYNIKKMMIYKSEEGADLIKRDGTSQNYIIFLQK